MELMLILLKFYSKFFLTNFFKACTFKSISGFAFSSHQALFCVDEQAGRVECFLLEQCRVSDPKVNN